METVKKVMNQNVYAISADSKIRDLLQLFIEKQVSGVPVVAEDNKLVGIVTDADVLGQIHEPPTFFDLMTYIMVIDSESVLLADIKQLLDLPVAKVMTKNVVTVTEDTKLTYAAQVLSKRKFKKLPVVRGGKLVGVVSRRDLVRFLVQEFVMN